MHIKVKAPLVALMLLIAGLASSAAPESRAVASGKEALSEASGIVFGVTLGDSEDSVKTNPVFENADVRDTTLNETRGMSYLARTDYPEGGLSEVYPLIFCSSGKVRLIAVKFRSDVFSKDDVYGWINQNFALSDWIAGDKPELFVSKDRTKLLKVDSPAEPSPDSYHLVSLTLARP